jgi:hypothetical protein
MPSHVLVFDLVTSLQATVSFACASLVEEAFLARCPLLCFQSFSPFFIYSGAVVLPWIMAYVGLLLLLSLGLGEVVLAFTRYTPAVPGTNLLGRCSCCEGFGVPLDAFAFEAFSPFLCILERLYFRGTWPMWGCCCCHRCLSKRFYDTFTGAATGAAHCGSFVGNVFSLLVVNCR